MLSSDRHDRRHVGTLSKQMDGNNRLGFFRDCGNDFFGVQVITNWIDVNKNWHAAQTMNRTGGRKECKARANNFVAWLNTDRHQSQQQRVAARCTTNRKFSVTDFGDRLLKGLYVWTANESAGINDLRDRFHDFGFKR